MGKATKYKNNSITDQNQKSQPTLKDGEGNVRYNVIILMDYRVS